MATQVIRSYVYKLIYNVLARFAVFPLHFIQRVYDKEKQNTARAVNDTGKTIP
jgi:hypothetical protein